MAAARTYIWTDYLSKVSGEWKSKVGKEHLSELAGRTGRQRATKALLVCSSRRPIAIGYVELIYAIQNNLPYGLVKNPSGEFVKASLAGVSAAAAGAAKSMPDDFRVSITNAPGKGAYPISSFTWLLIPAQIPGRGEKGEPLRTSWAGC